MGFGVPGKETLWNVYIETDILLECMARIRAIIPSTIMNNMS